jgi:hypothetical protein
LFEIIGLKAVVHGESMILMTAREQLSSGRRRGFHDGMRTDECDANSVDTFVSYQQPRRLELNHRLSLSPPPDTSSYREISLEPSELSESTFAVFSGTQTGRIISSSPIPKSSKAILSHTMFLRPRRT